MGNGFISAARKGLGVAGGVFLALSLSACGVSQVTEPLQEGLFGEGEAQNGDGQAAQGTAYASEDAVPPVDGFSTSVAGTSLGCPRLQITSDSRTITFHAPGGGNDAQSVMHRGEFVEVARECGVSSSGVAVKYGFSGRVLLGPRGKAGSITLPATLTVLDQGKAVVKTQKIRVVVNVSAGATTGVFSEVKEINVPIPAGKSANNYRIYIGFDKGSQTG